MMLTAARRDRWTKMRALALLGSTAWLVVISESGCATAGPNHVYTTTANGAGIHDLGDAPRSIDRVIAPGEEVVGLAYDFNTDHLFLRVAPTQVIRVVERPSGKVLREMPLPPDLHTAEPADLAIRSADRHLFALHPDGRGIIELTLNGEFVRRIELIGLEGRPTGLAYDQKNHRLLVLCTGHPSRVGVVSAEGDVTDYMTLPLFVRPVSLGYDSDRSHFFVPLGEAALGEFDATGQLVARHSADGDVTAIDAGPRSFVRVF